LYVFVENLKVDLTDSPGH